MGAKRYTEEEKNYLMNLVENNHGISYRELIVLLEKQFSSKFKRDAAGTTLYGQYLKFKRNKKVPILREDGPIYVLMLHTSGDKSSGSVTTFMTKDEMAHFLTRKYNEMGKIPEYTIFGKLKFTVEIKEINLGG